MAEIETNKKGRGQDGSKPSDPSLRRTGINKKTTRVDLTPMVDLGFLLLTFFVFTTTMTRPTAMQVDMPYDRTEIHDEICESCVMTVILEDNNVIKYYEGDGEKDPVIKETNFSPEGIRKILLEKKKAVKMARGKEDQFVLIIKPGERSTFKNFVDITDEVTINNIKRYYIGELGEADKKLAAGH